MNHMKTVLSWDEIIDTPLEAVIPKRYTEQSSLQEMLVEKTTLESWPAVMQFVQRDEYPTVLLINYVMRMCRKSSNYMETPEFFRWAKRQSFD